MSRWSDQALAGIEKLRQQGRVADPHRAAPSADVSEKEDRMPQVKVEYREIAGFPGYRVGDDGSVWGRRGQGGARNTLGGWRRLSPAPVRSGHLRTTLRRDGVRFSRYVHRLVLEAFVGPCPPGMECRHFPDRNPSNNSLTNLSWATELTNQRDRSSHGTDNRGERAPAAKLTWAKVRQIRAEYIRGDKRRGTWALASKYGVSQKAIHCIVTGQTWKESA